MKLGHLAFPLLARTARPGLSFALLIPVTYGPDIMEIALRAVGRHNRELSHSLISVGVVATVIALGVLIKRRRWGDAVAVWLVYVSHWPADFLTGTKPTWPGGPDVGLNLYDRPRIDWALELALLAASGIVYRKLSPPSSDRIALATGAGGPHNE